MSLIVITGCGLEVPDADPVTLKPTKAQVQTVLHELFPSLSEEEIAAYAGKLDIESALALKVEIDDIRRVADKLSKELSELARSSAEKRSQDLEARNGGFPVTLEAVGRAAIYDASRAEGRISLSGVFRDREPVQLKAEHVRVKVDGSAVGNVELRCVQDSDVDIVLLVDITGSMSSVIGAVRRSLIAFVHAVVERGVHGTLSVVTFQDTVGVNVGFQERAPANRYERSPFFKPVDIADADAIAELERFVVRLQANSGADRPENLAAAIDFARSNVIGRTGLDLPNVIGDGNADPAGVTPFPKLDRERQIFVAITDAPFHADSRGPANSSLLAPFKPRPMADILRSLQSTGTTVHVSDPSWVDQSTAPTGASSELSVDADYWAIGSGGLGEDRAAGYSLVDLDLLAVAGESGLLDIVLDRVISSSCALRFALPQLSASAKFELSLEVSGETFEVALDPVRL